MDDIPFFCRVCRAVRPHTFGESKAVCVCGLVTKVDRSLLVPGPRPLPLVERVSRCGWCGNSLPSIADCAVCGFAQTADISGSPSDLDVPEVYR